MPAAQTAVALPLPNSRRFASISGFTDTAHGWAIDIRAFGGAELTFTFEAGASAPLLSLNTRNGRQYAQLVICAGCESYVRMGGSTYPADDAAVEHLAESMLAMFARFDSIRAEAQALVDAA